MRKEYIKKEIKLNKITRKKVVLGKRHKQQPQKVEKQTTQIPSKGWKKVKVLGIDVALRKYKQTSVADFIKYNQELVNDFIKRREEATGVKIKNVRQYISNYARTYKYDFETFVKKAAADPNLRWAAHAYEILVNTGRIEDLQAEVNEEIEMNRIHYLGDNNYEYIGSTRKCRFKIHYQSEGRSHVDVEVFSGVDI